MRWTVWLAVLWTAGAACAEDSRLEALRATLTRLRAGAGSATVEAPGGGPDLTLAKHQLREWIEWQLDKVKEYGDETALAVSINETLKGVSVAAGDQNYLGSAGNVRIERTSNFLIVTTGVGILCQNDESAYLYRHVGSRWQREWESEQNDYSPGKYAPQHIAEVHVWQAPENGPTYVMTLGNYWGCASFWHSVDYRIWRLGSPGPKLLVDESNTAYLRADTYIVGSIARENRYQGKRADVLIEFATRSIDDGVHNREAIRHYLIDGDKVQRVGPVALSPRDFVDEWLTSDWRESAGWSAVPALQQWHRKLHADWVGGGFAEPTKHCRTPDLWQVAFEPVNPEKNYSPEPTVYFLVRWRPPYHFTLQNVSDKPWPGCTQPDPNADEWRTLFSTQEWR